MRRSHSRRMPGRFGYSTLWSFLGLVVLLALGSLVGSALLSVQGLHRTDLGVLGVLCVAAYLGELLRLRGLGPRGLSPIAISAAYAAALANDVPSGHLTYGAGHVVLIASVALILGVGTVYLFSRGEVDPAPYLVRLSVIALTAVFFRSVPVAGGDPPVEVDWANSEWRLAAAMVLVVFAAHVVEVIFQVCLRAGRTGRGFAPVFSEDLREMIPASLAALSTAVVIALGLHSLGLFAIPLFMVPLVLMRFAMQQQSRTNASRRQTVGALSQMTDLAGYTAPGHARRVAAWCALVGREMKLTEDQLESLEGATLLHDIGQVSLGAPIPAGATVDAAPRDQQRIADEGAEIARRAGSTEQVVNIIEQQAMPYRRLVEEGEPLTLPARILKVCNAYDDFSHGDTAKHENAILRLRLGLGYEYDPEVVEALARVISNDEVASVAP